MWKNTPSSAQAASEAASLGAKPQHGTVVRTARLRRGNERGPSQTSAHSDTSFGLSTTHRSVADFSNKIIRLPFTGQQQNENKSKAGDFSANQDSRFLALRTASLPLGEYPIPINHHFRSLDSFL